MKLLTLIATAAVMFGAEPHQLTVHIIDNAGVPFQERVIACAMATQIFRDIGVHIEWTLDRASKTHPDEVTMELRSPTPAGVLAHLYLPKNTKLPFQAVVFFGSGDMLDARSIAQFHDSFEFIVRSGRALIIPAFQGTLERGPLPAQPREAMLNWSKDLGRSIDYLETRADIDANKVAFFGYSYGAWMAPRFLAVEPRIRAALLISGGSGGQPLPAEVDPWNFVPYVKTPVLMLNGRDDFGYPVESSQLPLFRGLGTPAKDKRHILYEGGHINLMIRLDVMKEALDWFDRYLGPVNQLP